MPLYELLVINTHLKEYVHIRELVRNTAAAVLRSGGVVRALKFWGTRNLPQRMRARKQWYDIGDYWTMHYFASPELMNRVADRLRNDPRVIKCTNIKLGERLEEVTNLDWGKTIESGQYDLVTDKAAIFHDKTKNKERAAIARERDSTLNLFSPDSLLRRS